MTNTVDQGSSLSEAMSTIEAARIQAAAAIEAGKSQSDAAIQAAKIAADATINAGLFQGAITFAAAILALFAGYLAYRGAVRQVHLTEKLHSAKTEAYRFKINIIIDELLSQSTVASTWSAVTIDRINQGENIDKMVNFNFYFPDEFNEEHWESHALLGGEFVKGLRELIPNIRFIIFLEKEIMTENLAPTDFSSCPTYNFGTPKSGGQNSSEIGIPIVSENVIHQHRTISNQLRESLEKLNKITAINRKKKSIRENKNIIQILNSFSASKNT